MTTFYDPPCGHRYGFPKVYEPSNPLEPIEHTLRRDGYPDELLAQGMATHCRFWEKEDREAQKSVEGANDNGKVWPWQDTTKRRGDWMQTFSGGQFWPLDARQDEVHIEDIAHSLSLQCRYAGHCKRFYSVAEHSVLIANWIWWHGSAADALVGLLHDATEAYLVDMPRPVKRSLHEYRLHEAALWKVIAARFGLPEDMPAVVHEADNRIIADELVNMRPMAWHAKHDDPLGVELQFWTTAEAEENFLKTFAMLQNMTAPTNDDHYPQHDREASAADRTYQMAKEEAS